MKIAILACIHSNLTALEAVEKDIAAAGAEKVYCLGDVIGYGAHPRECIEFVRSRGWPTLRGNHEAAVLEPSMVERFNPIAQKVIYFTMGALTKADREWIAGLPTHIECDEFQLVHGSPADPRHFERYIMTQDDAKAAFAAASRPWVFCGHTHVPLAFFQREPLEYSSGPVWRLDPAVPALMNVGSVGQPRDKDPRSGWALFDTAKREVELRRVAYDAEKAATEVIAAGLPAFLGERLRLGR